MKNSVIHFVVANVLLLLVNTVNAQTFRVDVGEQNLHLGYANTNGEESDSVIRMDGQILYSRQNNHQDLIASAGIASFTNNAHGIRAGAGVKLIAGDPLDYYLSAIAPGVELTYRSPALPKFNIETAWHYAGNALTYSDSDSVSWLTATVNYSMTHVTSVRLGYHRIKTEQTNGPAIDFARGVYLGLIWAF